MVLSRGDRREAILRSEADRKLFLDLLGQTCRRTRGHCLMDNHFHLAVETPRTNLGAAMQ
jgi:putative transposase